MIHHTYFRLIFYGGIGFILIYIVSIWLISKGISGIIEGFVQTPNQIDGEKNMVEKKQDFDFGKYRNWLEGKEIPAVIEHDTQVVEEHVHHFKVGILAGGKYVKNCITRGCGKTVEISKDEFDALR